MKLHLLFHIALISAGITCSAYAVRADTINIPDDYQTIQTGIDAASDADTVLVQPGTYYENINFNGKNIVLGSLFVTTQDTSYISKTVIDGGENGSVISCIEVENDLAELNGFTITNGYAEHGGGIYSTNSNVKFLNLNITGNTANKGGGGIFQF